MYRLKDYVEDKTRDLTGKIESEWRFAGGASWL
jgi:hypothetical protein